MEYLKYKYNFELISENLTGFESKLADLEKIRYIENPKNFHKETAYLRKVDQKITYYYMFSNIKSRNYTPGSGYLTHGLDYYQGSFHGQMIRGLINYCNLDKNAIILDPFCGSGTTLIESKLLGFNSIGIDINPIACLNSKVKTCLLDSSLDYIVTANKKYFNFNYYKSHFPFTGDFNNFLKSDLKELLYTFIYMRSIAEERKFSVNRKTSFNRNLLKITYILSEFIDLKKKINLNLGNSIIIFDDSIHFLKKVRPNSIDAVITSPPYLDLIDYINNDFVQLIKLINKNQINTLKKKVIGNKYKNEEITTKNYWQRMNIILREIKRILKVNNHFILVINNYKRMKDKYLYLINKHQFSIERILEREVINFKKKKNVEYVLFLVK